MIFLLLLGYKHAIALATRFLSFVSGPVLCNSTGLGGYCMELRNTDSMELITQAAWS